MGSKLFKKIGFCTDFSENADQAFVVAKDLAVTFQAPIELIHVTVSFSLSPPVHAAYMPVEYDPKFIDEITDAATRSIQEKYVENIPEQVPYKVNIRSGYAATEILKVVEESGIDLLVMGSHGLTGIAHVIFGSTADRVVRRAACSVLTVRFRTSTDEVL
ncbi:MAG TPA: universal stress protein [Syntrophobacteraceae bacterium]|nr:universal stress protein [Syntrophobacteraceae bacterium]